MVENSNYLNCLRNGHLEKSATAGGLCPSRSPKTAKTPRKVHLRLRSGKREKAPHCGALWPGCGRLRLRPFILCFNRTAISIQKIDSKSSKSHLKSLPRISPKSYRHRLYLKPFLIAIFNFSHKRPTFAFTSESGYTLGFRRRIAHKGLHGETGAFRTGPLSLPSERSTRFGNPAWPDVRTANFSAFWPWSGVFPKNTESLRDSDALMRVAVPRRRGPAGLRDLFSFLSKLRLVCPVPDTSFGSPDAPACAVPVQAASQLVPFRLGVQWFSVETGRIFCYNFGKRVT